MNMISAHCSIYNLYIFIPAQCWDDFPTSFLNFPYSTFFRYFGMNTIWYWHFHLTCDKLWLSIWTASFVLRLACDTSLILTQEAFFCYPARFCLLHSPQHSWGIRIFIQNIYFSQTHMPSVNVLSGWFGGSRLYRRTLRQEPFSCHGIPYNWQAQTEYQKVTRSSLAALFILPSKLPDMPNPYTGEKPRIVLDKILIPRCTQNLSQILFVNFLSPLHISGKADIL